MKFQLTTAVWGRWYVERFLKGNLASLMSDGNIPALLKRGAGRYTIYTRQRDVEQMHADACFQYAASMIPFEFTVYPDSYFAQNPHVVHAKLWGIAVNHAQQAGEWIAFVSADTLWANGSLDFIGRQFESGKVICYGFPLRVVDETVVGEIAERFDYGQASRIDISPRDLVEIGLRHLSPMWGAYLRDTPHFANIHPEYLLDTVPGEGLVFRAVIAHCLAADAGKVKLGSTLSPVETCDASQIGFMTDSDDFAFLSFTEGVHQLPWYFFDAKPGLLRASSFWQHFYNADAVHLWRQAFIFHTGRRTPAAWRVAIHRTSARLFRQFVGFLAISLSLLAQNHGLRGAARLLAVAATGTRLHRHLHVRGPATLFVPNDSGLGPALLQELLAEPSSLAEFLSAHIALTAWDADVPGAMDVRAASGRNLELRGGRNATVNGQRIVKRLESRIFRDLAIPVFEVEGVLSRGGA